MHIIHLNSHHCYIERKVAVAIIDIQYGCGCFAAALYQFKTADYPYTVCTVVCNLWWNYLIVSLEQTVSVWFRPLCLLRSSPATSHSGFAVFHHGCSRLHYHSVMAHATHVIQTYTKNRDPAYIQDLAFIQDLAYGFNFYARLLLVQDLWMASLRTGLYFGIYGIWKNYPAIWKSAGEAYDAGNDRRQRPWEHSWT